MGQMSHGCMHCLTYKSPGTHYAWRHFHTSGVWVTIGRRTETLPPFNQPIATYCWFHLNFVRKVCSGHPDMNKVPHPVIQQLFFLEFDIWSESIIQIADTTLINIHIAPYKTGQSCFFLFWSHTEPSSPGSILYEFDSPNVHRNRKGVLRLNVHRAIFHFTKSCFFFFFI